MAHWTATLKEIYSRDRLVIWVKRPSLQSYADLFFAPYTFCRPSRDLIRATNADTTCSRRGAYIGYGLVEMRPNPGFQKCKVGPSLYTDFTPPAAEMRAARVSTDSAPLAVPCIASPRRAMPGQALKFRCTGCAE